MRVRFTTDKAAWARACEYAKATNRTPSELVSEALDQIQARYPKRRGCDETGIGALRAEVRALRRLVVQAGTYSGIMDAVADA